MCRRDKFFDMFERHISLRDVVGDILFRLTNAKSAPSIPNRRAQNDTRLKLVMYPLAGFSLWSYPCEVDALEVINGAVCFSAPCAGAEHALFVGFPANETRVRKVVLERSAE